MVHLLQPMNPQSLHYHPEFVSFYLLRWLFENFKTPFEVLFFFWVTCWLVPFQVANLKQKLIYRLDDKPTLMEEETDLRTCEILTELKADLYPFFLQLISGQLLGGRSLQTLSLDSLCLRPRLTSNPTLTLDNPAAACCGSLS